MILFMRSKHNQMNTLDDEWKQFLKQNGIDMSYAKEPIEEQDDEEQDDEEIVENVMLRKEVKEVTHEYELSISTKTEKLFLNCAIDIDEIFL